VADQNQYWPPETLTEKTKIENDPRVNWIHLSELGVVNARHAAASQATGEIFLFVDDDVQIIEKSFIENHAINYKDSQIDAVCGREIPADANLYRLSDSIYQHDLENMSPLEQTLCFPRNSMERMTVTSFCTCNSSVRRKSFFLIGGFDESFRGASYGDDYDFAIRLAKAGGKIVFDPNCVLVHLRTPQGGLRFSDNRNNFTDYDKSLSGLIFTFRYGANLRVFFYLFYNWVLRRTVLLKQNVLRPWRQPKVVWGLVQAWREARQVVAAGPRSRFVHEPNSGLRANDQ
jgi:GT2 family glycosyltransferase